MFISDPRVADWPMMSSPFPVLLIILAYLLFVLHLGPRFMQNRTPYSLHNLMIGYNVAIAICSAAVFYGVSKNIPQSRIKVTKFDPIFKLPLRIKFINY